MTRNEDMGPGGVVLFALVAFVGAVSAAKLIGPNSPLHDATSTAGTTQADLIVYPLVIGLPIVAVVALWGWLHYG